MIYLPSTRHHDLVCIRTIFSSVLPLSPRFLSFPSQPLSSLIPQCGVFLCGEFEQELERCGHGAKGYRYGARSVRSLGSLGDLDENKGL